MLNTVVRYNSFMLLMHCFMSRFCILDANSSEFQGDTENPVVSHQNPKN